MLSAAYYFLQVILCSAIMMGYYWIALRNKKFHQYNRFYLLTVAVFSWMVPLVKIQWVTESASQQQVFRFLSVVADNNSEIEAAIGTKGYHWSLEGIVEIVYLTISVLLLSFMVKAVYRIYQLLKTHSCKQVGDVFLIITQVKGTPFSFFRYIFWNEAIDIRSASGKQILQHELTHVQQKHSIDKLLIQLMLIPGWFNPFFWLLKKEMEMIHEFIADKKAVGDGDTAALAQMLLTAVYPTQRFELTHPFFFSPIKRRLQMLTNHKNPKFSYIRRLLILPLLAVVIVLFAFRNKEYRSLHPISVKNVLESVIQDVQSSQLKDVFVTGNKIDVYAPIKLSRTYRVVIHPGHGGDDKGARGINGTTEAVLNLQLAKMLKEKNQNPNLDIVLTRNSDAYQTVEQTAKAANELSPDLFLSIHMNSSGTVQQNGKLKGDASLKGAEIFVAEKSKAFDYEESYQLANWIGNMFKQSQITFSGIKSRQKGIYVLQAVKSPSILVEAGYLTNKDEASLLENPEYQEKIALALLKGIEQYLATNKTNRKYTVTDAPLDSKSIIGTPINTAMLTGDKSTIFKFAGNVQTIKKDEKGNLQYISLEGNPSVRVIGNGQSADSILYLLDGDKISYQQLNGINSNSISKIDVIKDPTSVKMYTEDNVKGVVLITSKKRADFEAVRETQVNKASGEPSTNTNISINTNRSDNGVIQKQEPVSFPGGEIAWRKYLERNLNTAIPVENGAGNGKYIVKVSFIVDKQGKPSEIKVIDDPGYGTAAEVVRIISKGPNWVPAKVNDKPVISRFEKTVTFVISDGDEGTSKVKDVQLEKVYAKLKEPPYFPGGIAAWTKYLERNLDKNIVKHKGGPIGKYTVLLTFQVDEQGRISNITSNDPGYGAKEEAERMLKKGPNWKPGIYEGKPVRAEHTLSITFVNA